MLRHYQADQVRLLVRLVRISLPRSWWFLMVPGGRGSQISKYAEQFIQSPEDKIDIIEQTAASVRRNANNPLE